MLNDNILSLLAENQSFSGPFQIWWDAHSMSQLKRCPRLYYYSIIRGLATKRMAATLRFGIIFHEAQETFYKAIARGEDEASAFRAVFILILQRVREEPEIFKDSDPVRTPATLLRAAIWHLDEFGLNDPAQTVILANGKPAVELSFKFPLELASPDGGPYMLCGHIDRLVTLGGDTYVEDYKTTKSALSSYYFDGWSPENQMSQYSYAGRVVFGTPTSGVIITGVQLGVTFSRSARGFAHRTPAQLDEWLEDYQRWLALAQGFAEAAYWPMNDKSCGMYGGCSMRSVCAKDPCVRESYLQTEFVTRTWDPTQSRD